MQINLFLLKKDGSIQDFPLPSTVTLIGRRQECDLCIPLSIISRKHCEICVEQNKLMIRDLHSRNGTFINDQQVEDAQLHPGDRITFGPVTFVVQINGSPAAEAIVPLQPAQTAAAGPASQPEASQQDEHFEPFNDELSDLHPGSSHTAEIPDIININDDLAAQP